MCCHTLYFYGKDLTKTSCMNFREDYRFGRLGYRQIYTVDFLKVEFLNLEKSKQLSPKKYEIEEYLFRKKKPDTIYYDESHC